MKNSASTFVKARETARDAQRRLRWKLELVKGLYEGGLIREDILQLFRFIDWMLALPPELEQRFLSELQDCSCQVSPTRCSSRACLLSLSTSM